MEKFTDVYQRFSQTTRQFTEKTPHGKKIVQGIVALLIFLFGVLVGRGCSGGSNNHNEYADGTNSLGINEAMDSLVSILPKGSQVVARFNDDRHALYYLNSGHLMKFNAKMKMLEEVELKRLDPELEVFYDDMQEEQGIIKATLTDDKRYLLLTIVTAPAKEKDKEPKTAVYRLDTETMRLELNVDKPNKPESTTPINYKPVVKQEVEEEHQPTDVLYEGPTAAESAEPAAATPATTEKPAEKPAAPVQQSHGVEETIIAPPPSE